MHILFICTGNTCRSPMAEGWLRHIAGESAGISVSSGGLYASDGERASCGAIRAMEKRGVDISGHRARTVTDDMLREADLVLCMSEGHCEALSKRVEGGKLGTLLGEAYNIKGPHASIVDPYLGDDEAYEAACLEICGAVDVLFKRILTK